MIAQTVSRENSQQRDPKLTCPYCGKQCGGSCGGWAGRNAVQHGLGINIARRAGRILQAAWEAAIAGPPNPPTAEEIADEERCVAEFEAGRAAYLAGIAFDDPILSTKNSRWGWKRAEANYWNGYRFYGSGLVQSGQIDLANWGRDMRAGWLRAQAEAETEALFVEADSPFAVAYIPDEMRAEVLA